MTIYFFSWKERRPKMKRGETSGFIVNFDRAAASSPEETQNVVTESITIPPTPSTTQKRTIIYVPDSPEHMKRSQPKPHKRSTVISSIKFQFSFLTLQKIKKTDKTSHLLRNRKAHPQKNLMTRYSYLIQSH
jgi:hypothetical protein